MKVPSQPSCRQEGTDGRQTAPQPPSGSQDAGTPTRDSDGRSEAPEYSALAVAEARRLRPDLDPTASKSAARTWSALVRSLTVAAECNDLRRNGVHNAPEKIAARYEVQPTTVRCWLHRAKAMFGIEIDPPPSLRRTMRDRYAEAIRSHCPEYAEQLADELIALRDAEIERLMYPTDQTGATP